MDKKYSNKNDILIQKLNPVFYYSTVSTFNCKINSLLSPHTWSAKIEMLSHYFLLITCVRVFGCDIIYMYLSMYMHWYICFLLYAYLFFFNSVLVKVYRDANVHSNVLLAYSCNMNVKKLNIKYNTVEHWNKYSIKQLVDKLLYLRAKSFNK